MRPVFSVVAIGSAVALSLFGDMAMYVILPIHFTELGITAFQVGILLSANRWVRLVTNRIAERMLMQHGSTVLFPAALLLGSVLTAAYPVAAFTGAPTFLLLLLLRMLWGLCWSFIRHTGVMTTVGIGRAGRVGRSMGIFIALLHAGFVAGTFAGGILFDRTGFQTTFLLAAALSLSALPAAAIGGHRSPVTLKRAVRETKEPGGRGFFLLEARGFTVSLVSAGLIMSTLGFLLQESFGESVPVGRLTIGVATLNGALLAAQYFINSVGSPFMGMLIDRQGLSRSQLVGFTASGVSLFALAVLQSTVFLIPLVIVVFVSAAICRLALESEAAVTGARAYSNLASATDLGSALGPVLGWIGIELSRSGLVFWAGGALFLLSGVLAAVERRARAGAST